MCKLCLSNIVSRSVLFRTLHGRLTVVVVGMIQSCLAAWHGDGVLRGQFRLTSFRRERVVDVRLSGGVLRVGSDSAHTVEIAVCRYAEVGYHGKGLLPFSVLFVLQRLLFERHAS